MRKGALVISLDFELYWGLGDQINYIEKKEYFNNTLSVIPEILQLFEKYKIHCTWATVGMLWTENWDEWNKAIPKSVPTYTKKMSSTYYQYNQLDKEDLDSKHFLSLDLIKKIANTQHQEIGSHTYSHYYCRDAKNFKASFPEDLVQAQKIAEKTGTILNSIVLPRNQYTNDVIDCMQNTSFNSVRTNPDNWYWQEAHVHKLISKVARLFDTYVPIIFDKGISWDSLKINRGIMEQPASRFFRQVSTRFSFLNYFRNYRIKKELKHCAKHNEVYHLWWHPHNFGNAPELSIKNLETILKYFAELNKKYDMKSYHMEEVFLNHSTIKNNHDEKIQ